MTNSGDAAEQIVRMSLEGTEVALKLSGSAAKNIAAALYCEKRRQKQNQGAPAAQRHAEKRQRAEGVHHQ